jgi:hypothetical protein
METFSTAAIFDWMCNSTSAFFLITNEMHQLSKFIPLQNSTCFGHFLCPSSRVFYRTFGIGKFHAGFDDRFQAESGWN